MHELGLAAEVIAIAAERAKGARVRRVVVEVGKLAAVLPDALRFAFEALVEDEGEPLHGAALEIVEVPGEARCRACGASVRLERPIGQCGACEGTDLEWLSGEELRVAALDLEPAASEAR